MQMMRTIMGIVHRLFSKVARRESEDSYSVVRSSYHVEGAASTGCKNERQDNSFAEVQKEDVQPGDVLLQVLRKPE